MSPGISEQVLASRIDTLLNAKRADAALLTEVCIEDFLQSSPLSAVDLAAILEKLKVLLAKSTTSAPLRSDVMTLVTSRINSLAQSIGRCE